jgi:hypothetical protein
MSAVRGVMAAILVGAILTLAGCSHDRPVLAQKNPPAPTSTSLASGGSGSAADVDAVVARLTDPKLAQQPLGADLAPVYLRIEMLGIGLTPAEAACVGHNAAKAGGSSLADLSLGDAGGSQNGLDPSLLLSCVGASRLAALAGGAPDFSRVPASDLRNLLSQLGEKELSSAGLSADEATCVVAKTIGEVPDDQLPAEMGGGAADRPAVAGNISDAVKTCLSPARLRELAS